MFSIALNELISVVLSMCDSVYVELRKTPARFRLEIKRLIRERGVVKPEGTNIRETRFRLDSGCKNGDSMSHFRHPISEILKFSSCARPYPILSQTASYICGMHL